MAGKWRWIKWPLGAFLVLLLVPVIWLATPYGQRVTVRFVVEHINDALPATEDPIQVSVEGIGVDRQPLGIALQGLAILVDEPGGHLGSGEPNQPSTGRLGREPVALHRN